MAKQKESIKCDICGELFIPRSSRQHFCRKKVIRKCLICGDEFETNCSPDGKLVCNKPECKKQGNQVSEPVERECKQCGKRFTTIFFKQMYCNEDKEKACAVCGKPIQYKCNSFVPETCSVACQAVYIKTKRRANIADEVRICKWCGKEFHPKEVRDVYCEGPHFKNCAICGKEFEIDVRKDQNVETCSKECMGKLMSQNHDYDKGKETQRKNLLAKYGVENAMQIPGVVDKIKETNLQKYGSEWYTQTDEYKQSVKQTCQEKYGVDHHLQAREVIDKRLETCERLYGAGNVLASDFGKEKSKSTMLKKYGVEYNMQVPEFRRKAISSGRQSKLETRICDLLSNYGISYIQHHVITKDNLIHEFDFFIPDYKLLIDADGAYFHGYLDDPDGMHVREDYDEVRLELVPEDCRLHIIVEGNEDQQVKEIVNVLEETGGSFSKYDSMLFNWCRSIDFPYPSYSTKRMNNDFKHLVEYTNDKYVPECRLGQSLIKHFHKSIYHCKVRDCISPYDGWYDDNKLKQVIRNRLIYKNNVEPAKILAGFNMSKICPSVSTFNPVLAKYLIKKYLATFSTIFDPFSGFSGRLIGAASLNKGYIGQDLNINAVQESNEIIKFLELDSVKYSVIHQDILESSGDHDCILTCPPYNKKEVYYQESIFKTCDQWIEECLNRFKCSKYVFVVDSTENYKANIVEELHSASHLTKAVEYVIVI